MNGKPMLWIDQYGQRYRSQYIMELKAQLPGRVSKMYQDKLDGRTVQTGYVIGKFWLTGYQRMELPA